MGEALTQMPQCRRQHLVRSNDESEPDSTFRSTVLISVAVNSTASDSMLQGTKLSQTKALTQTPCCGDNTESDSVLLVAPLGRLSFAKEPDSMSRVKALTQIAQCGRQHLVRFHVRSEPDSMLQVKALSSTPF
jgi:hypothetical protein